MPAVLAPSSRSGVDAVIERILGLVAAARIAGSWDRMKTCANDGCRWLYFDHSPEPLPDLVHHGSLRQSRPRCAPIEAAAARR